MDIYSDFDNDDLSPQKFVDSLDQLPETEVIGGIIRLFFECCENVFFNIEWWDNLPEKIKKDLISSMKHGINAPLHSDFLKEREINAVNWTVIDKGYINQE